MWPECANERLRIATWNFWWRFGPWEARQPAIVETLRRVDADVWCLQEVFETRDGVSRPSRSPRRWAGTTSRREPLRPRRVESSFGNAVLSRWPITDCEMRPLPAPDGLDELRCVMRADIAGPNAPFEVFSRI